MKIKKISIGIFSILLIMSMPVISNIQATEIDDKMGESLNDPRIIPIAFVTGEFDKLTLEEERSNGCYHLRGTGTSDGFAAVTLKFWCLRISTISTNNNWRGNVYSEFEIKYFIGNINHAQNSLFGIGILNILSDSHE